MDTFCIISFLMMQTGASRVSLLRDPMPGPMVSLTGAREVVARDVVDGASGSTVASTVGLRAFARQSALHALCSIRCVRR